MRQIAILTLTLLLLGAALPAIATETAPLPPEDASFSADERLGALVRRVRWENERIETLEAEFVQKKESALLQEPEEARGAFSYAAPDRVRWEYRTPNPISLLIEDGEMTTWYRDMDQVERISVGRQSQKVLEYLGASGSLDALLEYFEVALRMPVDPAAPYQLDLDPRFARVERRVRSMSLWIDRQRFLPIRLRYEEADGDVTEYRFDDIRLNAELPAERFVLEIPDGVEVREITTGARPGAP